MARKALLGTLILFVVTTSVFAAEWAAKLEADPLAASVRMARLEKKALPLLKDLLVHESASVRRGAALAAGRIGKPAATLRDPLLAMFADKAPAVRAAAAWAIARLGLAAPPLKLFDALGDDSVVVRRAAAGAIEHMGNADHARLRDIARGGDPRAAKWARRVLASETADLNPLVAEIGTAPDDLVEALLNDVDVEAQTISPFLHHENGNLRLAAIRALVEGCETDEREADVLAKALRHFDPEVREEVARVVEETDAVVSVLLAALEDPSPEVRDVAVRALPVNEKTLPALQDALTDPAPAVRRSAMSQLRGEDAIDPLLERLGDRDPEVAADAADRIGLKDEAAVPGLIEILERPGDARVRFALRALGMMYGQGEKVLPAVLPHLDAEDPVTRLEAANAVLANLGEPKRAVEIMVAALAATDPSRRLAACRLIANSEWRWAETWEEERRRNLPIARELVRIKWSAPGRLGAEAARALRERGFTGFPRIKRAQQAVNCVRCLSEERADREAGRITHRWNGSYRIGSWYVNDHYWITPWACVRRLGDAPGHLALLRWAANSGDPVLADWAEVSLRRHARMPPPAIDSLVARLSSPDAYVRWRAVKDLAARGEAARAAAENLEALRKDPNRLVRIAAAAALERLGRKR